MDLQSWVSIVTIVAAMGAFHAAMRREVRAEVSGLRTELKGGLGELRTELKGDIAELRTELKGDIGRLDDRIYALAAGLGPTIEARRSESG